MPAIVPTIWCDLRGHTKGHQRGILLPYIIIMQVAATALIATKHGLYESIVPNVMLSLAPLTIGALCGLWLFEKINDMLFRRILLIFLLLSGASFII